MEMETFVTPLGNTQLYSQFPTSSSFFFSTISYLNMINVQYSTGTANLQSSFNVESLSSPSTLNLGPSSPQDFCGHFAKGAASHQDGINTSCV
jgi:hypothetical protein